MKKLGITLLLLFLAVVIYVKGFLVPDVWKQVKSFTFADACINTVMNMPCTREEQ